jgi:hypothetical protein
MTKYLSSKGRIFHIIVTRDDPMLVTEPQDLMLFHKWSNDKLMEFKIRSVRDYE